MNQTLKIKMVQVLSLELYIHVLWKCKMESCQIGGQRVNKYILF